MHVYICISPCPGVTGLSSVVIMGLLTILRLDGNFFCSPVMEARRFFLAGGEYIFLGHDLAGFYFFVMTNLTSFRNEPHQEFIDAPWYSAVLIALKIFEFSSLLRR